MDDNYAQLEAACTKRTRRLSWGNGLSIFSIAALPLLTGFWFGWGAAQAGPEVKAYAPPVLIIAVLIYMASIAQTIITARREGWWMGLHALAETYEENQPKD